MADVQKMKFSRKWWQKFQKNRGMKWKRICNKRKTFTNDEVEKERQRIKEIIQANPDRPLWNFDESAFHPNYAGNFSADSPVANWRRKPPANGRSIHERRWRCNASDVRRYAC